MSEIITPEEQQPQTDVDNEKLPVKKSPAKLFCLILLLIAVAMLTYGIFALQKIKYKTAKKLQAVTAIQQTNQAALMSIQEKLKDNDAMLAAAKTLSAQQAKLVADFRSAQQGDLLKWQVAEAQNLTQLANDQIQFNHDINLSKLLLQRADEKLATVKDPQVLTIRKAIADDLANLNALPPYDKTTLYLKVASLNQQIDRLPLIQANLPATRDTTTASVNENLSWWKAALINAWEGLKQIVVIRKINNETLPLSSPEEKNYLYLNLHNQFNNMIYAVLHQNNMIFQTSRQQAANWINAYFDLNADITKNIQAQLSEFEKMNIDPPTINFSTTLKLFADFFNQPEQQLQAQVTQ